MPGIYINAFAVACALGNDAESIERRLLSTAPPKIKGRARLLDERDVPAGSLDDDRLAVSGADTRSNRIADHLLRALGDAVPRAIDPRRLAVVVGTSTSGVGEIGDAMRVRDGEGRWPEGVRLSAIELGDVARHVASRTGARGPVYGVSTACTSGAKAMASAARLIEAGFCDVAVAGGVDALCDLTLNGFAALELLSGEVSNPFSANRRGINLGEGGALFVMSRTPSAMRLAGWGESADAYHISSPDPEGRGAEAAMRNALSRAQVDPRAIGYLNLHGTGTLLNDLMEARAIERVFGRELACSSTKPMTGHMLGAAGACEAAFAMMSLSAGRLPAHLYDGAYDPALPPVRLVAATGEARGGRHVMSCSYAFGGNNIALILEAA